MKNTDAQAIAEHAKRAYPRECCGALGGRLDGDDRTVQVVLPVDNVHEDGAASRFRIDGRQMLEMERQSRACGYAIIGFYHSHPDHPAVPSEYDRKNAWPVYSYLIVSVANGVAADFKSWLLAEGGATFNSEPVELIDCPGQAR